MLTCFGKEEEEYDILYLHQILLLDCCMLMFGRYIAEELGCWLVVYRAVEIPARSVMEVALNQLQEFEELLASCSC